VKVSINTFYPTKPHAKQKEILDYLDGGGRFVGIRAGRKFRKTSLLISWLFEGALETGLVCPYVAPNRLQAKNIAWNDHVQRVLDGFTRSGLPYKKNESELKVILPNGGVVQLLGVENKEALRGISNWGRFAGDEYDDWSEDIWGEIVLPNLIVHKAPAIMSGTPKGFRNLWRLEKGNSFKFFHYTSHDNPDLDREEIKMLEDQYKEMGMGTYRQEILAEYEKPEGTVYAEWDMEKQYIPILYDPNLPVHVSWDFGINDPTSVIIFQRYGKEVRVIDYYEAAEAELKHFTDWLDSRPYKRASLETGDIAGRQRSLITGKSVLAEARNLGHSIRTMPIPDIPSQIRHAHRSIPYLFVNKANPNTERFVECILNYKYPKKAETLVNQENETPIHDEFSHAMRAFEYYCWNYTNGGVGGFKEGASRQPAKDKFFHPVNDRGQLLSLDPDKFAIERKRI
jgi:phage terminase large subunit